MGKLVCDDHEHREYHGQVHRAIVVPVPEEKTMKSPPISGSDLYNGTNETKEWLGFLEYNDLAMMSAVSRCYYQLITALLIPFIDEEFGEDDYCA